MKALIFAAVLALAGCASTPSTTLQTHLVKPAGISGYQRAYVVMHGEDEFQVASAMNAELGSLGLSVLGVKPDSPAETDLQVDVTPEGGWDMSRYLQGLQVQFMNAKTTELVLTSSFRSNGIWMGARDKRLRAVFNDIRAKLGRPETATLN